MEDSITIIDITDPEIPFKISSFDTPGFAYSTYVKDNIAYVADGEKGLVILDISNPQKPTQLSIFAETHSWSIRDYRSVQIDCGRCECQQNNHCIGYG